MPLNPADVPLVGDPDWPPQDEWELARLDAWTDAREREWLERHGHGDPE
jgi:hypothetical protein